MSQADATIANVATPSIHVDLGASGAMLELVIGGYLLAFAVFLITGARLGETRGYRRVFLLGIGMFSLASLLCGLSPDPAVLVGARVLQGAGAALMFPQTLTGIQLNFSGAERARAIGLYAIALSTGAVVGQILGGVLISANLAGNHWRAIFLINVPIGAAAIMAGIRYLPADAARVSRRIDLPGVAMLSTAVLLVLIPLTLGRSAGWPAWTGICLAASIPAFAVFVAAQRRISDDGGSPLVNVNVITRRSVLWGLLTMVATSGSYFALLFTLAQYLQLGLGRSVLVSGLTLVPWVAAFGLAGQLVSRLPAGLAQSAPAAGCAVLAGAYTAISAALFTGHHSEALLIVLLAIGGFGLGIQFSSTIGHLTTSVAPAYASDISGVTSTTSQIGGALGVAAFGTLYLSLAPLGAGPATHAFAIVTAALAALILPAVIAAYRATHGQRQLEEGRLASPVISARVAPECASSPITG